MCGRYALATTAQEMIEHFKLMREVKFQPSFNIAPGRKILNIVELDDGSLKPVNLHWGLVPSWAKDTKNSGHLINARAETVKEKPSFRSAFKHRRCLIPATGFYEWARRDGKQAYNFHRPDHGLFAFAGLWEQWQHETETLYSCTIITTAAAELMQPIHDRMPVIITPGYYRQWLNKAAGADEALELLDNQAYAEMTATPVSDWVNKPGNDGERCVEEVAVKVG
ncbi:SOS response-associated peptidase [Methylomonas sp. EFPC1]|uniref:SOS response-associated peptidase n=1 Tax=Methylomonas sp. EFPC1 TaxID=2812647 RepID=UPI00196703E6|nr:SOS response-associated peptidase [Methylomonas sp. EFPC1]QSB02667.1 SOS response-associated peptidase [Methylomonas sp. EFPC1]